MFFTKTIQRKLVLGLGLVLVMVVTLAISGITGLHSYRNFVRELDRNQNQAPHRAQLARSVAMLFEPLRLPIPEPAATENTRSDPKRRKPADSSLRQEAINDQQKRFEEQLRQSYLGIDQFHRRMDALSSTELPSLQRTFIEGTLIDIRKKMRLLAVDHESLNDLEAHDAVVNRMLQTVADLELLAEKVDDPADVLGKTLQQALTVSKTKLNIIYAAAGAGVLIFLSLMRFSYTAIFDPIRKLHQGAIRVAHGDFDFRLQLTTRDEMAELAAAFNEMANRFQDTAGDLDRQVRERSQQLVRSERLAGVGFLSAGVAHEINNPLAAISMAAESVAERMAGNLEQLSPDEIKIVRQYLEMIQNESVRCRQITERLLDFARGRDHVREPTDITRLVTEVVGMVQHLSKYREKHIEFAPHSSCLAEVNGPEIKQVILNLVANGLEAMDRGKTLRIQISEQTDNLRVQFDDEGCGMTQEVIEKIFEPFFTQKEVGQGTGLGLSISHRIVNQHGGSISVSSPGPGQGSSFCVRLPRRAAQRGAA